nr:unnamed protein product [Digitaria exilis]
MRLSPSIGDARIRGEGKNGIDGSRAREEVVVPRRRRGGGVEIWRYGNDKRLWVPECFMLTACGRGGCVAAALREENGRLEEEE